MKKALLLATVFALAVSLTNCATETQASEQGHGDRGLATQPGDAPATEARIHGSPKSFDSPPKPGQKATCPVMEHQFVVTEKSERSEYQGKHVAFCCAGCKSKFDADPAKYLK